MKTIGTILQSLFIKGIGSSIFALIQLLFLLLNFIPSFLLRLWVFICAFLKKKNFKEEDEAKPCRTPYPEEVFRRPDPCIYSQSFLQSQGLPVTWNNPDILLAKKSSPNTIEPDSYHLEADTEYLVFVKVHNASVDLALGVKVRLLFREWSFNDPIFHPIAKDANGNEIIKYINVEGMQFRIATFPWKTPKVLLGQNKHYCLQVQLSHPLDLNPANNIGQENTRVYGATSSPLMPLTDLQEEITLFNHSSRAVSFQFKADAYHINNDQRIALQLQSTVGVEKWPLHKRLGNFIPTAFPVKGGKYKYRMQRNIPKKIIRQRYAGYKAYKAKLLETDFSLPPSIKISIGDEKNSIMLDPGKIVKVPVKIQFPIELQKTNHKAINIQALTDSGRLVGGVTYLLN